MITVIAALFLPITAFANNVVSAPNGAALCSAQGGANLMWGAVDPQVADGIKPTQYSRSLSPEYAPFTFVEVSFTPWSGKIYNFKYEASLDDEKSAKTLYDHLLIQFGDVGWRDIDNKQPMPHGDLNDIILYANQNTNVDDNLILIFVRLGKMITVECSDTVIVEQGKQEKGGQLPKNAVKPVFPTIRIPANMSADACNDPLQRTVVTQTILSPVSPLAEWLALNSAYSERLATWKKHQLLQSGKISAKGLDDLTLKALSDPAYLTGLNAEMKALETYFGFITRIDDAVKAKNDLLACQHSVTFLNKAPQISGWANPQTQPIHQLIDREAKRLGISFE